MIPLAYHARLADDPCNYFKYFIGTAGWTRTTGLLIHSQKFLFGSAVTATSFANPRFGKFARMVSATYDGAKCA
jgi:hypothetical protein